MSWYKTGTVAVTPGSNAVIGTGTSFIRNARVGDGFRGPDGGWYEVTNIASDTALSIAPDYQGAAAAAGAYSLAPMQGYVKDSADALRAATQVIASGVADMEEQVATATEAAESAGQSKATAIEQAGIAVAAAEASTNNKDAAQLAAQQGQQSAQASGEAADRAETAKDSIIQSEQAAAASATAAQESADRAEEVTQGKAASGDNNDITSLRAITADGFDRLRQGIAPMVGATAALAGKKGLVPAPSAGDQAKFLAGDGTYKAVATSTSWGDIGGTLSAQADLKTALDAKLGSASVDFAIIYPNGGTQAAPATVALNSEYSTANPFTGFNVITQAEFLYSGNWYQVSVTTVSGQVYGAISGQVGNNIILKTALTGLIYNISGWLNSTAPAVSVATAPCRIKVWKVKA